MEGTEPQEFAFAPMSSFTPRQIRRLEFFQQWALKHGRTKDRVIPVIRLKNPPIIEEPDGDHND